MFAICCDWINDDVVIDTCKMEAIPSLKAKSPGSIPGNATEINNLREIRIDPERGWILFGYLVPVFIE